MALPRETYVPTQAEQYSRELEGHLADLGFVLERISQEMLALVRECRGVFRKSRLVLYAKRRPGESSPYRLYWGILCKPRKSYPEMRPVGPEKRWRIHIAGGLTHDVVYSVAKEVAREPLLKEFDRRAKALNEAYGEVRKAIVAIENRLLACADRRPWEGGDLDVQAPLILQDLRPRSRSALGGGWFILLRMAALEYELISMGERYNADPAFLGFRLAFERDSEHPFGRLSWLHYGGRLPRLNRNAGARENLTDQVMRQLHLPEADRRRLARHELRRRKMTRLQQRYTRIFGAIKRICRVALAKADAGVLAAQPRQVEAG